MANSPFLFDDLPAAVHRNEERLKKIELNVLKLIESISANPNQKYTLPEAAEYCRMAVPTFRRYLARRLVSGIKFGKSWVFTQEDLDMFLQKYRVKTSKEITEESDNIMLQEDY